MYSSQAPNYSDIAGSALAANSKERQTAMGATAQTMNAGVKSLANTQAAAMGAEAKIGAAKAGAEADKMGAIMGGLGSLAGAFGSMGKDDPADYTNNVDFGDGTVLKANDNGRLLSSQFDFRIPGR